MTLAAAGTTDSPAVQLWAGIGFSVVVLVILVYIFLKTPVLTDDQRRILRFFCSFMAACSGAFISGSAFVEYKHNDPTNGILIQGTAGFALFFVVWFTFDGVRKKSGGTGFSIAFDPGMPFARAADILANEFGHAVDVSALKPDEQNAGMKGVSVQAKSARDVLAQLWLFTADRDAVRPFRLQTNGVQTQLLPKSD